MAPSPKHVNYVAAGEVWEVLEEQLRDLLLHKQSCKIDAKQDGYSCSDCWRLDRVKDVLLIPFKTEKFHMKRKKSA